MEQQAPMTQSLGRKRASVDGDSSSAPAPKRVRSAGRATGAPIAAPATVGAACAGGGGGAASGAPPPRQEAPSVAAMREALARNEALQGALRRLLEGVDAASVLNWQLQV
jgi:hypothetical protein